MSDDNVLALACQGDLDGVKRYLSSGGDVNFTNSYGINAAIATNLTADEEVQPSIRVAIIEELVRHGIDLEQTATFGRNSPQMRAIHFACLSGQGEVAAALVKAGADVNGVDGAGKSALYKACQDRHEDIIQMLIENGADASIKATDGSTPLILIADPIPANEERTQDWDKDAKIGSILIKAGVDVDAQDEEGASALIWCTQHGHHELARVIIQQGKANVNLKSSSGGCTALYHAVVRLLAPSTPSEQKRRMETLIDVLMDGGADETIKADDGMSPWDLAEGVARVDVMKRIDTLLRAAQT